MGGANRKISLGLALGASIAAIEVVAYHAWIFPVTLLTQGDWGQFFTATLTTLRIDYFSIWLSDTSFGRVLIDSGQAPTYALYGFLAKFLGANYPLLERLIHFWPILIFGPLGAWLMLGAYVQSPWAKWTGTIVYSFNTYFLILQTGDVTLAAAWAFAPLLFYFFRKTLLSLQLKDAAITALVAAVCCAYEPRIFYVMAWVLILFSIYQILLQIREHAFRRALGLAVFASIPFLVVLALNAYWILGLAATKGGSGLSPGGGLFGNQFFDIAHSLTLHFPYWNGREPIPFIVNPIPAYFWLIPILAVAGLILNRKNREIIFFGLLAAAGLLLAKQASLPFPGLYQWLFIHVPGFNAFREGSKFYGLIALSYSVLIAALIDSMLSRNVVGRKPKISPNWAFALVTAVAAIFLFNLVPFATTSAGTLFKPRQVPQEYRPLNSMVLNDGTFSRSIWFPTASRWGLYTALHPIVSALEQKSNAWKSLWPATPALTSVPEERQIVAILGQNYAQALFNASAIKYLVIPTRDIAAEDDIFAGHGNDRSFYVDVASALPWLRPVNLGTKDVAVYENPSYKPYFSALTTVVNLASTANLEQKYRFITEQLHAEFAFAPPGTAQPGTLLTDPFEAPTSHNIYGGTITAAVPAGQQTAHINQNQFTLAYQVTGGNFVFLERRLVALLADGKPLGPQIDDAKPIGKTPLRAGGEFVLGQGSALTPVDPTDPAVRNLGAVTAAPVLYSVEAGNRVDNPQAAAGLWRRTVEDCNNYDPSPLISMGLATDDQRPTKVIELTADRHTACTGPAPVLVSAGQQLMVSFDYRVIQGRQAGYQLRWTGPGVSAQSAVERNYLPVTDNSWRTLRRQVVAPPGATGLRLVLEAFPNDSRPVEGIERYDALRVSALSPIGTAPVSIAPVYVTAPLPAGARVVSVTDPALSGQNLVANPSLENGLWQPKVGDCNAYDDNPDIGMQLDTTTTSDGHKSLRLTARRHIACTGPPAVPVQEGRTYLLSVDYQSPNSKAASVAVAFNDPAHSRAGNTAVTVSDSSWHTFNQTFTVPFGATEATITLAAGAVDPPVTTIINRYDNVRLVQIASAAGQYWLTGAGPNGLRAPAHIGFTLQSPTKKLVHVTGATTPFYLAMSEAYHPGWRLELAGTHSPAVGANNHFALDDFLNGWYVDPAALCRRHPSGCTANRDGSYNLELVAEFLPQRWFYIGLIISAATLLGCLVYLAWAWRKRH